MIFFTYVLIAIFNFSVISQFNDIPYLYVDYLNFELIDGINVHKISFEFNSDNKNISITTINNCLFYTLHTNLCVALFKYVLQSQLDIINKLTKHEITHQHQHFSRLIIIQELLYSNYNLFLNTYDIRYEKLVLCISHYDESLTWLHAANTPFVIVSKSIYSPTHLLHVPINAGNEVSSYLLYIITYYEVLPEFTLFVHGHEHAWHQFYPITYIIKHGLNYQYQYQNINNLLIEHSLIHTSMIKLRNVWEELFQLELGNPPNPFVFHEKCCAQFNVHRDRILLRSKHFYQTLYNYTLTHEDAIDNDGYHSSMSFIMELIWHYIFGENNNNPNKIYYMFE